MSELTNEQLILRDFNEDYPNHSWSEFISRGPPHMTIFEIQLTVNNAVFKGCGSAKRSAKINAVKKFRCSNTEMNSSIVHDEKSNRKRKPKTISTVQPQPQCLEKRNSFTNIATEIENSMVDITEYRSPLKLQSNVIVPQFSPVSILHEMFPGQNLEYEYEGPCGVLVGMSVYVYGNKYTGYGHNKKEAKEIACRNALIALYEEDPNLSYNNKYKDQIEMLRVDFHDSKIIDYLALITSNMHQELDLNDIKTKEYCVIASIIKVNS